MLQKIWTSLNYQDTGQLRIKLNSLDVITQTTFGIEVALQKHHTSSEVGRWERYGIGLFSVILHWQTSRKWMKKCNGTFLIGLRRWSAVKSFIQTVASKANTNNKMSSGLLHQLLNFFRSFKVLFICVSLYFTFDFGLLSDSFSIQSLNLTTTPYVAAFSVKKKNSGV